MLLSALGLPLASVRGQGPSPAQGSLPKKTYAKTASFDLPVVMDDALRAKVQEVRLYVKTPTTNWKLQESGQSSLTKFTCRVPEDGEYWFSLATVERGSGRQTPEDVSQEPPNLRVILDRQSPSLQLQPGTGTDGEPLLHCTVQDTNASTEPGALRAVAKTPAGDMVLESLPGQPTTFRLRGAEAAGSVRVTATDLAGNVATQEISSRDLPFAARTAAAPPPVANPRHDPAPYATPLFRGDNPPAPSGPSGSGANHGPTIIDGAGMSRTQPYEPVAPRPYQPAAPPPAVMSQVPADPPAYQPPVQATSYVAASPYSSPPGMGMPPYDAVNRGVPAGNRQLLNTTRASVDYRIDQVGPSGVGKVDVYVTTDQGQSWQRFREITDRRSPAEVDLPGEGTFGIRLVITNGNGFGGTPPRRGDQPDCWVEVDTTGPFVQLQNIGVVPDTSQLEIRWTASDKNLGPVPVSLFYRTNPSAPWQQIVRNIKNDGSYRWSFPRDCSHFFFKVEVTDLAGNTARVESPTPMVLDMTEPRASVVGVSNATVRPAMAAGN
jgi:hypothetical protein